MVTEQEKMERTIPELSELVRKKKKINKSKLEKCIQVYPSREFIFLCKYNMNAFKLADANESSSRMLLQIAIPPCSPAFSSIFTEFYTVSYWLAIDFYMATSQQKAPNWYKQLH